LNHRKKKLTLEEEFIELKNLVKGLVKIVKSKPEAQSIGEIKCELDVHEEIGDCDDFFQS